MNKLVIRKLGILSVAKMYAVLMLVMSLLIAVPYGLIIIVISLTGASSVGGRGGLAFGGGGILAGLAVMIGFPIFYGVAGFIGGCIASLLYNLFAGMVGGIEIEVENVQY